ncbi:(2Fe-2S)-binding protein [Rhizobium leguminosarum]|uniref:(2Fe-2S)-binding protein n=1 Tax=Rhizobium leguminosarum TaxID=384 RepID=UPI001C8FC71D|nr:(2Fe-2S)-binding protein [Rhizobium leguminosarum]MBY2915369.1 (2Fe-2S)-binding protein [Rhizobium leguminosarum]MBY2970907.1 (2Fe-2S)-binding protein [Rhizobium leguminosarum]MBY2977974.1 (2Fe-2S)-binding protein [Rhizobium leguminosarum]MBY3006524.1 (2Fe-2S)-binding protein [Rhizobium leguminosarum]
MAARFRRLAETHRKQLTITIDGQSTTVLEGDSVLVALMLSVGRVRQSDFGDGARAGFCLMGACQDCWVWCEDGDRLRACSTLVDDGMRLTTKEPEGLWPILT